MTNLHRSVFIQIRDLFTELDLIPTYERFHRTLATGIACWQGTLTLPDICCPPILDLHMFFLLRPILFPIISYFFRNIHFEQLSDLSWLCFESLALWLTRRWRLCDRNCSNRFRGYKSLILVPSYCSFEFLQPNDLSSFPNGRSKAYSCGCLYMFWICRVVGAWYQIICLLPENTIRKIWSFMKYVLVWIETEIQLCHSFFSKEVKISNRDRLIYPTAKYDVYRQTGIRFTTNK